MKRGYALDSFTILELVFVIVILGVLAAIAIPRLAMGRDDALAIALKKDIQTIFQAVPAVYLSQGESFKAFSQAVQLDTSRWRTEDALISSTLSAQDSTPCVRVEHYHATQNIPAQNIKVGDKILQLSIQANTPCHTLNNLFHKGQQDYQQSINLSGYGIPF